MGTKTLIAIVCGVVLLIAAAVGAYAWDDSKSGEIAEGVRVGSIDLGGLDEQQATELLKHELVKPLPEARRRHLRRRGLHAPRLRPRRPRRRRRDGRGGAHRQPRGRLPSRLIRYATGGEVDHQIDPEVAYSETAVERFVEGVAAKVNTEPQDASDRARPPTSLEPVPGEEGRAVREDELRDDIKRVLESGDPGPRTVKAKVETVEPEVTTEELAAQYPDYITVDRASFTLRHYESLELASEYTVAVGQAGYDTPTGRLPDRVEAGRPGLERPQLRLGRRPRRHHGPRRRAREPAQGSVDGDLRRRRDPRHRRRRLARLGSQSHGCIRMAVPDVIELYDQVEVGTPVYIQ